MKYMKLSWRLIWYSVMIWFLAIILSSVLILPWFYVVMPFVIFWATLFYLKKEVFRFLAKKRYQDKIFTIGLALSLFWFFAVVILNIFQIIGPYYSNTLLYFSDFRNWFMYPLILLVPVVYSLVLENKKYERRKRKHTKHGGLVRPHFGHFRF